MADIKESIALLEAISGKKVKLTEGTWKVGTKEQLGDLYKELTNLSAKSYNICGDDEFFNGIQAAIKRLENIYYEVASGSNKF